MDKSIEIQGILTQIKKLDYKARLYIMENLAKHLRKTKTTSSSHRLTELSGLGAEIWEKVDIDEYVHQERQWE